MAAQLRMRRRGVARQPERPQQKQPNSHIDQRLQPLIVGHCAHSKHTQKRKKPKRHTSAECNHNRLARVVPCRTWEEPRTRMAALYRPSLILIVSGFTAAQEHAPCTIAAAKRFPGPAASTRPEHSTGPHHTGSAERATRRHRSPTKRVPPRLGASLIKYRIFGFGQRSLPARRPQTMPSPPSRPRTPNSTSFQRPHCGFH